LVDEQLLKILRCPQDQSLVSVAESQMIVDLNDAIRQGNVLNLGGQRLRRPIDGGLVRQDGDILYPIREGIPVMLPDEGVELSQLAFSD